MKKNLSAEPETLGIILLLRRYSNKGFASSKLNFETLGGRIFGKSIVRQKM